MSRIHDALKKAEKERSYRLVGHDELDTLQAGPIPVATVVDREPVESEAPVTDIPQAEPDQDVFSNFSPPAQWKPDRSTMLFFDPEREPEGTEEFRALRSRLCQLREKTPLQKILISSALPREGKSFVSANLAQALARQPNSPTLLIDADLRNPSLHRYLGTPTRPGLTEFLLEEEEDEFAIVQRGPMENLFFISSGRPVNGQSEILSGGRLRMLMERMASVFQWIIVDSPAAAPVSDAALIAKVCDGVLVTVRSNSTPCDVVSQALRKLPSELVIGVVLNGIPAEAGPSLQRYYTPS